MTTRKCIVHYGFGAAEHLGVEMTNESGHELDVASTDVFLTLYFWAPQQFVGDWIPVRTWIGAQPAVGIISGSLEVPLAIAIMACATNRNVRNVDQDIGNVLPRGRLLLQDIDYIMSWLEDTE